MKKHLLLFSSLLLSAIGASAYSFTANGLYLNDTGGGTAAVTYKNDSYNSYSGDIVIPETVTSPAGKQYTITAIGESAFRSCSNLTSVFIPTSVTIIGESAFCSSKALTSVHIASSVSVISDQAFQHCESLEQINLPSTITKIGIQAFDNCSSLKSVAIPLYVETIGDAAFVNCKSLEKFTGPFTSSDGRCLIVNGQLNSFAPADRAIYTLPAEVTKIGYQAFSGFRDLKKVILHDNVTTIGLDSFSSSGLIEMNIPLSVTKIEDLAFVDCPDLKTFTGHFASADQGCLVDNSGKLVAFAPSGRTTYTIPSNVKEIGAHTFMWNPNLTQVTIPGSVTEIGLCAFLQCTGLTSVNIPASVQEIGHRAFSECTSLATVTVDKDTPLDINGSLVFMDTPVSSCTLYVPKGAAELYQNADIWENFGNFEEMAFQFSESNADGIPMYYNINKNGYQVTVTYRNSGYNTYSGNVVIPAEVLHNGKTYGVNKIGDYAFLNCENLTSVSIPEGVITTGTGSFRNCTSLKDVKFPKSLYDIGDYSFLNTGLETLILPDELRYIRSHAFSSCANLTTVRIPRWCLTLEEKAFAWCNIKLLTMEVLDPSLITLGETVFYDGIDNSAVIEVPKGKTYDYKTTSQLNVFIMTGGFKELGYHLRINNGDTPMYYTINDDASSVSVAYQYEDEKAYSGDIVIPSSVKDFGNAKSYSVTTVGEKAFYHCTDMTSVEMPETITKIDTNAFNYCTGLTEVTFPYTVTTLGSGAFQGCNALKTLTINESINSIGSMAFAYCTGLESVTVKNDDPANITLGSYVFFTKPSGCMLYVPDGSQDKYRVADQWKDFNPYIEAISASGIHDILVDTDSDTDLNPENTGIYYDLTGRPVANPTRGIYILNGRKVLLK